MVRLILVPSDLIEPDKLSSSFELHFSWTKGGMLRVKTTLATVIIGQSE